MNGVGSLAGILACAPSWRHVRQLANKTAMSGSLNRGRSSSMYESTAGLLKVRSLGGGLLMSSC